MLQEAIEVVKLQQMAATMEEQAMPLAGQQGFATIPGPWRPGCGLAGPSH